MTTIRTDSVGDTGTIIVSGPFDFNSHGLFREAANRLAATAEIRRIDVDLGRADYLDSSALGMLLLLREECANGGKALRLIHCHDTVLQVLQVAHFDQLFTIS